MLLSPFYGWGNWCSLRLEHLSIGIQLIRHSPGFKHFRVCVVLGLMTLISSLSHNLGFSQENFCSLMKSTSSRDNFFSTSLINLKEQIKSFFILIGMKMLSHWIFTNPWSLKRLNNCWKGIVPLGRRFWTSMYPNCKIHSPIGPVNQDKRMLT